MLTCGLIILSSFLAQAEAPPATDFTPLQGTVVELVFSDDAPLPQGWAERRRSGRLDRATPRPRNPGEFALTITWDEPWAAPVSETVNDTVRDASGRIHKLLVLTESKEERVERITRGWGARGFELIGSDPLDPLAWVSAEEVNVAKQAQQMAREYAASTPAPETVSAAQAAAPAAQEREPAGMLTMRGPQLLIGLTALVLAGVVVKTLVL